MIHKFLTFSLWAGSAPWARRSSTTARCPPAQARDRTVWSFVEVARFTSAPTQYTYSYKQLIKLYILNHSIWLFILESPSIHYLCWSEIAQYRDIQPWQLSSEEFGHLLIHAPANNIYIIRFDECMLIKWKKNCLISLWKIITNSAPCSNNASATSVWPFSQAYVRAVSPVPVVAWTFAPKNHKI